MVNTFLYKKHNIKLLLRNLSMSDFGHLTSNEDELILHLRKHSLLFKNIIGLCFNKIHN